MVFIIKYVYCKLLLDFKIQFPENDINREVNLRYDGFEDTPLQTITT